MKTGPHLVPALVRRQFRVVELTPDGPIMRHANVPSFFQGEAAVVKPLLVGICRSDLKEVKGERPSRRDFGHEIVGVVEWATKNAGLEEGAVVCLDPHVVVARTSGFGELMTVEGSASSLRRALPTSVVQMPPERMVFWEPLACAWHCISKILEIGPVKGTRIGVVGAGIAGALMGLLAKGQGADVMMINRSPSKLRLLRKTGLMTDDELRLIHTHTIDEFPLVVVATSFLNNRVLRYAAEAVQKGGLIVLFGGTQPGYSFPDTQLDIDSLRRGEGLEPVTWKGKTIRIGGTYGAKPPDFIRAMEELGAGLAVERLITREIRIDDLVKTLEDLAQSSSQTGKTVVRFA